MVESNHEYSCKELIIQLNLPLSYIRKKEFFLEQVLPFFCEYKVNNSKIHILEAKSTECDTFYYCDGVSQYQNDVWIILQTLWKAKLYDELLFFKKELCYEIGLINQNFFSFYSELIYDIKTDSEKLSEWKANNDLDRVDKELLSSLLEKIIDLYREWIADILDGLEKSGLIELRKPFVYICKKGKKYHYYSQNCNEDDYEMFENMESQKNTVLDECPNHNWNALKSKTVLKIKKYLNADEYGEIVNITKQFHFTMIHCQSPFLKNSYEAKRDMNNQAIIKIKSSKRIRELNIPEDTLDKVIIALIKL